VVGAEKKKKKKKKKNKKETGVVLAAGWVRVFEGTTPR